MNLINSELARQFDRLPPHSLEAERALLGSLLKIDGDAATVAKIRQMITADSFFQADHSIIYTEVLRLLDAGKVVDGTTLAEALKSRQLLEEVGGYAYLGEILTSVPHGVGALDYAGIIREKSLLRGLITIGNDMLRRAYGPLDGDAPDAMAMQFSARAAKLATTGKAHEVHRLADVAMEVFESRESGTVRRIPTGLESLDRIVGGLRVGGKTIVAARPGMGKSLLLKQIGLNLARRGVKFGVVSVEESRHKIAENALSNVSGVINNRIAFAKLSQDEWSELARGLGQLDGSTFYIVDSARRLTNIIAAAQILRAEYGCEVIGVDHVHIVDGETDEHREREISKISAELKWTWKDLGVAGIECAQLNRGSGRDRPTLASLRDSGSLEQDADTVILLHREDYFRPPGQPEDHIVEAIIAKNKDGATGVIPCHYDGARQRIADLPQTADPF